ncbi:MAG: TraB/GumN family protein [Pseudomonadales bacterium]
MRRSRIHPRWLLVIALAGPSAAANIAAADIAAADIAPAYEMLPARKALAQLPGNGADVFGVAHSQPTDLAASELAIANCEANRSSTTTRCEITHLNDEAVTTGQRIRAQVASKPHPLYLWRYRSESSTVYLAGSIHVLKPSLYPLPPQLDEAFGQSDYLVLEVDTGRASPADRQAQALRFALLPGQQTLPNVLPALLYERLNEHLLVYGMNAQAMDRAKPAVIMNELVLARLTALGYRADYGLEQHFRSRLGVRRILELESIESQLDLLFNQPMETQIQLLTDTLDQEYLIEPLLAEMLVAWLSGNDDQFVQLFAQQGGDSPLAKAFNRQLLEERNVGMAKKVRSYLGGQGTYFVLAGAAHLIGAEGIVALLADQHIIGHRVMSDERATISAENERN